VLAAGEPTLAEKVAFLDPRFGLPSALIRRIDRLQPCFLAECRAMLEARVHRRRIVDGHGDLRPEHIRLDRQVRIIDCLEFNPRLHAVDPSTRSPTSIWSASGSVRRGRATTSGRA
jgi:aminoglycoside phosphotransferase family enzyme